MSTTKLRISGRRWLLIASIAFVLTVVVFGAGVTLTVLVLQGVPKPVPLDRELLMSNAVSPGRQLIALPNDSALSPEQVRGAVVVQDWEGNALEPEWGEAWRVSYTALADLRFEGLDGEVIRVDASGLRGVAGPDDLVVLMVDAELAAVIMILATLAGTPLLLLTIIAASQCSRALLTSGLGAFKKEARPAA